MKKTKIVIHIIGSILLFLILGAPSYMNTKPSKHESGVRHSPMIRHIIPPPYFHKQWFVKDAAESFMKNNLEIDIASTSKDEHMHNADNIKECMKIFVTSDGKKHEACILTFEKKEDLEAQQGHYLALNEKGELYNWSFVKDNMLVVLDGSVSEEDARLYEDSLYSLKEDK